LQMSSVLTWSFQNLMVTRSTNGHTAQELYFLPTLDLCILFISDLTANFALYPKLIGLRNRIDCAVRQ